MMGTFAARAVGAGAGRCGRASSALVVVGLLLAVSSGDGGQLPDPEPRYITFLRAPGAITKAKPFGNQCPDNGCVTEWVPESCTEQTFGSILTTLGLTTMGARTPT